MHLFVTPSPAAGEKEGTWPASGLARSRRRWVTCWGPLLDGEEPRLCGWGALTGGGRGSGSGLMTRWEYISFFLYFSFYVTYMLFPFLKF